MLLSTMFGLAAGHGSLTIPQVRNSIDRHAPQWKGVRALSTRRSRVCMLCHSPAAVALEKKREALTRRAAADRATRRSRTSPAQAAGACPTKRAAPCRGRARRAAAARTARRRVMSANRAFGSRAVSC
jgi:hypothetical protein